MVTAILEGHRWTREDYERRAAAGVFGDRRVELVDGVVYDMTPQNGPHITAVSKALQALWAAFPPAAGFYIRPQGPLPLGAASMPEPDLAVIAGRPDDHRKLHPVAAVLVLEVSDTSELHDRNRKALLYAQAGIADYWIANLVRDHLEVFRDPQDGVYRSHRILRRGERIAPLANPGAVIAVDDLLPSRD